MSVSKAIYIALLALFCTAALADSPGGRLTLVSGVPVTVADISGAAVAYFTPAAPGAAVPITTDGVNFTMVPFAELSNINANSAVGNAGPAPLGANQMVDFFLWSNAGTITFTRGPAWSSDNIRANDLHMVNGIWVNNQAITNGPAAGLGTYVTTCRSNAASQLVDTASTRWCWNAYNWQRRQLKRIDAAGPFAYNNTQQWQRYNNNPSNQLDFVIGLVGTTVALTEMVGATYNGNQGSPLIGIFIDGASQPDVFLYCLVSPSFAAVSVLPDVIAPTAPGRHYAAAYQIGGGPTTTWYGPLVMSGDIWN